MRVVRRIVGTSLLLLAAALLLSGAGIWAGSRHRSADGGFAARLEPFPVTGAAIVVEDTDVLLGDRLPLAQVPGGTVRLVARDEAGPLFVGLAARPAVAGYLAGAGYTAVADVQVSPGPLPVSTRVVDGTGNPVAAPGGRAFWVRSGPDGVLAWVPAAVRGEHLALVAVRPDGSAPQGVRLRAAVSIPWLAPAAWICFGAGMVILALAILLLVWSPRGRSRSGAAGLRPGPLTGDPVPVAVPAPTGTPVLPAGGADLDRVPARRDPGSLYGDERWLEICSAAAGERPYRHGRHEASEWSAPPGWLGQGLWQGDPGPDPRWPERSGAGRGMPADRPTDRIWRERNESGSRPWPQPPAATGGDTAGAAAPRGDATAVVPPAGAAVGAAEPPAVMTAGYPVGWPDWTVGWPEWPGARQPGGPIRPAGTAEPTASPVGPARAADPGRAAEAAGAADPGRAPEAAEAVRPGSPEAPAGRAERRTGDRIEQSAYDGPPTAEWTITDVPGAHRK